MSQSKRELRAERKAAREALERAEAASKARRRRWLTLGGMTGVAAAILVVAIAVSASGGATESPKNNGAAALVAGIPESDGVLGEADAPITVTEYLDPQCPICAEASKTVLPHLINTYVKTGKVKLKAATMSFIGPDSVRAAKVSAGARAQGKQWAFLETFYASQGTENSGYVTDDFLTEVAEASGVNAKQALEYADTPAAQEALDNTDADAQTLGVNSTPTFVMQRNGTTKVIAVGLDDLQAKLDKALS